MLEDLLYDVAHDYDRFFGSPELLIEAKAKIEANYIQRSEVKRAIDALVIESEISGKTYQWLIKQLGLEDSDA